MAASRTCSECPTSLRDRAPTSKTCGEPCRKKRARRLKRTSPAHLEKMADAVTHAQKDALHETTVAVLTPIVKEAITDDILIAIEKMVALTPKLIDVIAADLDSQDDQTRGRAMSLLARYTLGNASVAPQANAPSGQTLEINLTMPQPGDVQSPAITAEAVELNICAECNEEKPLHEFREQSQRCNDCDATLRKRVLDEYVR